jgi:hypothetical protein
VLPHQALQHLWAAKGDILNKWCQMCSGSYREQFVLEIGLSESEVISCGQTKRYIMVLRFIFVIVIIVSD